jgi:hypothetical protein
MKSAKSLLVALAPFAAVLFSSIAPEARAQAQSLLSSNQVVVTRVEPVLPDAILITGINFGKSTPVVSLFTPTSRNITTLNTRYTAGSQEIVATLPVGMTATAPGTYRLMVSFGPGTAATDVFEFTIGAVGLTGAKGDTGAQGLKGDQGIQGIQGIKGDKGDQGIQGVKGDTGVQGAKGDQGVKGDTGEKGDKGDTGAVGPQGITGVTGLMALPIFQTKRDATAGGVTVGQFWVQANSGQVYRMMDLRNDD